MSNHINKYSPWSQRTQSGNSTSTGSANHNQSIPTPTVPFTAQEPTPNGNLHQSSAMTTVQTSSNTTLMALPIPSESPPDQPLDLDEPMDLDELQEPPPATSAAEILATLRPPTTFDCNICKEECELKEIFTLRTICGHAFCYDCIQRWIKSRLDDRHPNSCPMCRTPMFVLEEWYADTDNFHREWLYRRLTGGPPPEDDPTRHLKTTSLSAMWEPILEEHNKTNLCNKKNLFYHRLVRKSLEEGYYMVSRQGILRELHGNRIIIKRYNENKEFSTTISILSNALEADFFDNITGDPCFPGIEWQMFLEEWAELHLKTLSVKAKKVMEHFIPRLLYGAAMDSTNVHEHFSVDEITSSPMGDHWVDDELFDSKSYYNEELRQDGVTLKKQKWMKGGDRTLRIVWNYDLE
ncbi:hypothetical protein EJ08DRAFT_662942 [Tothia fuscella]|uniref:RING-type domain-containing protein n=1 Tax=Tothia fuscella TaxID=1048955 RepID=A0A9P4NME1_9PEZI|nr:hypothetical protein EJ08DRAFT_662942 [Tothia fuscella]